MIHLGKNTKSKIISKGISAGKADNTYRGLVDIGSKALNSRNYTQCDSLLGNKCGTYNTYIKNKNSHLLLSMKPQHRKLMKTNFVAQRGLNQEEAVSQCCFCSYTSTTSYGAAVEAQKLVSISLEGSVG